VINLDLGINALAPSFCPGCWLGRRGGRCGTGRSSWRPG